MKLFADVQTPPGVADVKVMLPPSQTVFAPVIAATTGAAFTVTFTIEDCVVHPAAFVTVTKYAPDCVTVVDAP